jgi:hypothetical protein
LLLIAAVLAAGAAIAVTVILTGRPKPERIRRCNSMIPAYRGPDALARLAGHSGGGRALIVNPSNGPGAAEEPAYRRAIAADRRAGAEVLGYVHTGYGARDTAAVLADVQRYRSWYGVDGVFVDEAGHTDDQLPYYRSIARALRASGERVVLNPGVVPTRGYFDIADVVVTFEGPAAGYATAVRRMPPWLRALPRARVAHLLHSADREQAMQAAALGAAGWFYATSGPLPDPWSTLPPYLDALEARLNACA